jgi:uncharacterized protein
MAKIIAWLIVIVVVLLALRMINMRNARARQKSQAAGAAKRTGTEPMVRCARCGVYLPRAEAQSVSGGYVCAAGQCAGHA